MTSKFSDISEALKAVIPATGDHRRTVTVPIWYTHPGKCTDRRLMHAIVNDG